MEITDLQELQKTLEITSLEDIDKYKALQVATLFPKISEMIFETILQQVPSFFSLLEEGLKAEKEIANKSLEINEENMKSLNNQYEIVLDILRECQKRPNITFEESKYFVERAIYVIEMSDRKDTENKEFINQKVKLLSDKNNQNIKVGLGILAGIAGIGLVALGTVTNNQSLVKIGTDKAVKKVVEVADKKGLIK